MAPVGHVADFRTKSLESSSKIRPPVLFGRVDQQSEMFVWLFCSNAWSKDWVNYVNYKFLVGSGGSKSSCFLWAKMWSKPRGSSGFRSLLFPTAPFLAPFRSHQLVEGYLIFPAFHLFFGGFQITSGSFWRNGKKSEEIPPVLERPWLGSPSLILEKGDFLPTVR